VESMEQPFSPWLVVSTLAAEDVLLVTLRCARHADRETLERCMLQIAETLAVVECTSTKELADLCWEHKQLSSVECCFTLRRVFTDPDYPQNFDAAYNQLVGTRDSRRTH
jgi:hypothetical protein